MAGENEVEYEETADRDLPSVARGGASNTQKAIGAAVAITVAGLAIYAVYTGSLTNDGVVTDPINEEYVVNTPPLPVAPKPPVFPAPPAVIAPPAAEPVTQPPRRRLVSRPKYDPAAVNAQAKAQKDALDRIAEEQKRLEARRKSKQIVIGSGLGSIGFGESEEDRQSNRLEVERARIQKQLDDFNATGQAPSVGGSPLGGLGTGGGGSQGFSGTGENAEFFDAAADSEIPTERAVQLENLDEIIPQGTIIKGIMETRVVSDLPGMLRAVASEDTYSFDGSNILVPRGSRIVGRYNSGVTVGQTRVFVIWERIITPSGLSIRVNSPGTDPLGAAGNTGDVDNHWDEKFGAAILISVIEGAISYAVAEAQNSQGSVNISGLGDDSESIAGRVLDQNINIPPTITIDQGARINIFVSQDLDFTQ